MTLQELCAELQGIYVQMLRGDLIWEEYLLAIAEAEQAYRSERVSAAEY